jgi:hypothetical protein
MKEFKDPKSAFTRDTTKPVRLLVISAHADQNFYELFRGRTLANGRPIEVEQTGWGDLSMTSYSDSKTVCTLSKPYKPVPGSIQEKVMKRTFQPDYVLVRNVVKSIIPGGDRTNALFGLMTAQLPAINSLHSVFCMTERPLMVAEMIRLNRQWGQGQFPIFTTYYYSTHSEMIISPEYPAVVKIGCGHAGFGKMKLDTHHQFQDLKSVIATSHDYCTAEPYIEGAYDLRIQKVGPYYKVFRRTAMSGNWKTNTGTAMLEKIDLLPRYKFWADECAKCFGGMDIITVDVLVSKADGSERILEFNGTASGFGEKEEDNELLAALTVEKMSRHFCAYMYDGDDVDEKKDEVDADAIFSSAAVSASATIDTSEKDAESKMSTEKIESEATDEAVDATAEPEEVEPPTYDETDETETSTE